MIERGLSMDALADVVSQVKEQRKSQQGKSRHGTCCFYSLRRSSKQRSLIPSEKKTSRLFSCPEQSKQDDRNLSVVASPDIQTAAQLALGHRAMWKWLEMGAALASGLGSLRKRLCQENLS